MFIPSLDAMVLGTIIFIPGSAVIFVSQMCKLYRAGCAFPSSPATSTAGESRFSARRFELRNLAGDWPGVGVDLGAGLGGLAYLVGSYLFLPSIAVGEAQVLRAAMWFLAGGCALHHQRALHRVPLLLHPKLPALVAA